MHRPRKSLLNVLINSLLTRVQLSNKMTASPIVSAMPKCLSYGTVALDISRTGESAGLEAFIRKNSYILTGDFKTGKFRRDTAAASKCPTPRVLMVCKRYSYAMHDLARFESTHFRGSRPDYRIYAHRLTKQEQDMFIEHSDYISFYNALWGESVEQKESHRSNAARFTMLREHILVERAAGTLNTGTELWEFPKGRVSRDSSETPRETAMREYSEETLSDERVEGQSSLSMFGGDDFIYSEEHSSQRIIYQTAFYGGTVNPDALFNGNIPEDEVPIKLLPMNTEISKIALVPLSYFDQGSKHLAMFNLPRKRTEFLTRIHALINAYYHNVNIDSYWIAPKARVWGSGYRRRGRALKK